MALQLLVENFKPDINTFKVTVSKRKITESELKSLTSLNTLKLSESVKRYFEQHPIATLEGKDVYRLPISRYDWENDNGRVYEKRLWQRVIDEQKEAFQGNVGLADHPDDDDSGKFKEAAIVWLNMGLDESGRIVWGEGIFVGDNGRLAEEVMSAGGRVGFSTSGFGELDESDKKTVRWDSYQLERPADIVLNPSQKVFGKSTDRMPRHEATNIVREDSERPDTEVDEPEGVKSEDITAGDQDVKLRDKRKDVKEETKCSKCGKAISGKPHWVANGEYDDHLCDSCFEKSEKKNKKENAPMSSDTKLSKLEERKFRRDVGVFLEEADKITDPKIKLEQLTDIAGYFNEGQAPDIKVKVDELIKQTEASIAKAIVEHGKLVETFGVDDIESLKEGIKRVAVDTQLFERDATEWKEIATGLQEKIQKLQGILNTRPTIEAYKTSLAFSTRIKETFKKKEEELLGVIEGLKTQVRNQKLLEQQMIKELTSISKSNEDLTVNNRKLREYGEKVRDLVIQYRERDEKEGNALQERVANSNRVNVQPTRGASVFAGFSEKSELQNYYLDLVKTYGEKEVAPHKSTITSAKTLREGMKIWLNAMAEAGTARTSRITDALEPEDRQRLIESQTGTRIRKQSKFQSRLPPSWE